MEYITALTLVSTPEMDSLVLVMLILKSSLTESRVNVSTAPFVDLDHICIVVGAQIHMESFMHCLQTYVNILCLILVLFSALRGCNGLAFCEAPGVCYLDSTLSPSCRCPSEYMQFPNNPQCLYFPCGSKQCEQVGSKINVEEGLCMYCAVDSILLFLKFLPEAYK